MFPRFPRRPLSGFRRARQIAPVVALAAVLGGAQAQAADAQKGRQLYGSYCAICHGSHGQGAVAGVPHFDRGEGLLRPDADLLTSIRSGKNASPAYRGILSDREILDVIAFLRTLP